MGYVGRGFLTGKIAADAKFDSGDFCSIVPRFQGDNLQANLAFVDLLSRVAKTKNATTGQIALAWISSPETLDRAHPRHDEPGTYAGKFQGADVEISSKEMQDIESALAIITAKGERYPEHLASRIDR